MRVGVLPRVCLVAVVAAAPLACAGGSRAAGLVMPGPARAAPERTREQILNRDRALVAGLATSLAFGLVGLGTLLANANFASPRETVTANEMPSAIAIAGGVMSLGMLMAVPFGVAVDRHRGRYADIFPGRRGPRATASLRPNTALRPAPLTP